MFAEIRYRTGSKYANYQILQSTKDLSFDSKYLDVGAISLSMRQEDVDALGLGDQSVIEIAPNGQSMYNNWYAVDATTGTKTADDQLWRTLSGKSIVSWLTDCIVYPSSWPETGSNVNPDGTITPIINGHSFQNATPGTILATLIARGQERGGLQWLDWSSFSGTQTSDGSAWASTLTVTYTTGQTLLQVLQDLASRRILQFRMNGLSLEIFNYDTHIQRWTPEQVSFQRGRNILEHTDNTDSSQAGGTILIEGDTATVQEYTDSALTNAVGRRRERYVQQGGITDAQTLAFLAQAELAVQGHVKSEETLGVKDDGVTVPWFSYDVGDWIWVDVDGTLRNVQVRQIAASGQDQNNMRIGLTLGDWIDDQDIQLQKRIDNITGQGASGYGALPNPTRNINPDMPTAPLQYVFTPYRDANGRDYVQIQLTWGAVTTNVDGTECTDLDHYEVQYQTSGSPWSTTHNVIATMNVAYFSGVPVGAVGFLARVRAVNHGGLYSPWLTMDSAQTLPRVTSVPVAPSAPTVTPLFQSVQVYWDGHDMNGGAYGSELARVDVYVGLTPTFAPISPLGSFPGNLANTRTVNGLAYNTTYYVKLIAVDKSGNSSVASAASSAVTAAQLSDPDLPAKLVTGAKIADSSISVSNLTVASFGPSPVPNGGFEDPSTNATDAVTGAARWTTANFSGSGSFTIARDTTTANVNTGSASLKSVGPGSASIWIANTDDIPTAPGDVWYVKASIKASRAVTNGARVYANFGQPGVTLPKAADVANPTVTIINNAALKTTWQTFEGQVIVPSGTAPSAISKMRLILSHETPDASPLTLWWDAVEARPLGGSASIKDASIVNAKITDLSVDKLTYGTLTGDILVAARIKTANSGARVEINSYGFYAYDTNGNQTVSISSYDGSAVFSGTLQVPSQQANAANDYPGQTTIDQKGFRQGLRTTVNTVPNPYPEFTSGWSNSFNLIMSGGTATGGTYTLRFRGQTTASIAWNATAATVQNALTALGTIGAGNVTVALVSATANVNGGYTITFAGSLANTSTPPVVVASNSLTGTNPQKLAVQLQQAGTPPISLTSGITATKTSSPTYLNGSLSMLYGAHGLEVSHSSNTGATVGFPIGTHYEPDTFADFAAAGTSGGNIEAGRQYVVSWYAMPNPVSSASTPNSQPCFIDMSKVSIAYYDPTNTTLQGTVKFGIDGFISNVTPDLATLGQTYAPPTVYPNPISSGLFDLWKISNLPQYLGGSSDLQAGSPLVSDYGWKRFYATFTAPNFIPDGCIFRLTLPATPLTSGGSNNSSNMYVLYNAIQCELAGSAGVPLPTRFCAAINTSGGLVKSATLTMPQCVALPWNYSGQRWAMPAGAIPTHSDTTFNGFVHIGSTTADDMTVGSPANVNSTPDVQPQVLTVQGQANITGNSQFEGGLAVGPGADPKYAGFSVGSGQSGLYYYEEMAFAATVCASGATISPVQSGTYSFLVQLNDYPTGGINGSTGVWTCPAEGVYMFTFNYGFTSWVSGSRMVWYLTSTGQTGSSSIASMDTNMVGSGGTISATKYMFKGDTVQPHLAQYTGGSVTINENPARSYFSVRRCL